VIVTILIFFKFIFRDSKVGPVTMVCPHEWQVISMSRVSWLFQYHYLLFLH